MRNKALLPLCLVFLLSPGFAAPAGAVDVQVSDAAGLEAAFDEDENTTVVRVYLTSDIDLAGDLELKGAKNTDAPVDYHLRTDGHVLSSTGGGADFAIDGGARTVVHLYDAISLDATLVVANGALTVEEGADVAFAFSLVGDDANYPHAADARLTVDGGTLRIVNTLSMKDAAANNRVSVENGGRLEVGGNAEMAHGNNTLRVSGAGSAAVIGGVLFLNNEAGTSGVAGASVESGGLLETDGLVLGGFASAVDAGEITVSGAGSRLVVNAMAFSGPSRTNASASSIRADGGALITLRGGDGLNVAMSGYIAVGADARLEMLADAAARRAAVDLRYDGAPPLSGEARELRVEAGGTFRSELGLLAAEGARFEAGSLYEVHVDGPAHDELRADLNGSFAIDAGATLLPVIADTTFFQQGAVHTYQTIALDNGGMDGAFAVRRSLTLDKVFFTDASGGFLRIARDAAYAAIPPPGAARNLLRAARAFDAALARSDLSAANRAFFNILDAQTDPGAYMDILHAARADHHPVSLVNSMGDARVFQELVFERMSRTDGGASPCGVSLWSRVIEARENRREDGGPADIRSRRSGLALGAESAAGSFRFGAAAGYVRGRARYGSLYGGDGSEVLNLAAYGQYRRGAFRLDLGAGYASAWRDLSREGTLGRAESAPRDDVWSGGALLGWVVPALDGWRAAVEAGAFVRHVRRASGEESGSGFLPRYVWDAARATSLEFPLGFRLGRVFRRGSSFVLTPEASARCVFLGGSRSIVSGLGLADDPSVRFVNCAPERGDGYARFGARLAARLCGRVELDVSASVAISGKWREQSLSAGLAVDF